MIEIRRPFLFAVASLLILSAPPTEATAQVSTSDVDAIFAAFSGPNCARAGATSAIVSRTIPAMVGLHIWVFRCLRRRRSS